MKKYKAMKQNNIEFAEILINPHNSWYKNSKIFRI
jgi:hypothetical protein